MFDMPKPNQVHMVMKAAMKILWDIHAFIRKWNITIKKDEDYVGDQILNPESAVFILAIVVFRLKKNR